MVRWYCHSCVWWDGSDGSDLSHVMVTGNKGTGDKHYFDSDVELMIVIWVMVNLLMSWY